MSEDDRLFEEKCAGKLTVEQQSKTNWLREQFQIVKEYPEEDFFLSGYAAIGNILKVTV